MEREKDAAREPLSGGILPTGDSPARTTEPLYRALLESSSDSIKILDLEGRLLSLNKSGHELLEIDDISRWLGMPWIDLWAGEHRESVRAALDDARGGKTGRFEGYRTTAKGRPMWWDVVVTPVFDESNQPHRLLAVARDVTDRKRAEDAVRCVAEASFAVTESLDYEQTIANISHVLVPGLADWCLIDIPGPDEMSDAPRIYHRDPDKAEQIRELCRRLPSGRDDPLAVWHVVRTGESHLAPAVSEEKLWEAIVDPETLELVNSFGIGSVATVPLKARGRTLGAITAASSEGGRIYTEDDLPLLEELGRICGLAVDNARLYSVATTELGERRKAETRLRELNDSLERRVAQRTKALEFANSSLKNEIRDRKRAERSLEEANRQLTIRNRELQEFAYAASHDLQEPLRKISSFADLMRTDYEELLPEPGRELLDRIQRASMRLSQLIRDLLVYSRVETQRRRVQPIDLNRVLSDVLIDLEVSVSEAGATVECDTLPVIEADHVQMRQLFQNLISNALKFRHEGVSPNIRVWARKESPGDDECAWDISVEDNGIGFDQKYERRIFAPFQRLHQKTTYAGMGMGLAICRRIVENHGGKLSASGVPGRGATFTVRLPEQQRRENRAEENVV